MLHFTWHSFCHIIWHFIGYLARPGGVVSSGRACHNWRQQGQGISCYNRPSPGKWKKRGLLALGLRSKFLSWLHGFVGSPPEKQILIHLSQLGLWSMSWAPCLLSRWPLCFLGSLGSAQPRMANRSRYGLKGWKNTCNELGKLNIARHGHKSPRPGHSRITAMHQNIRELPSFKNIRATTRESTPRNADYSSASTTLHY